MAATAATALSWNVASYALFRFLTGAGIGGEYTAINSTIQELVPARYRGWTDLVINGSFWIGAAMGAVAAIVLLDPAVLAPDHGWRLAYFIGAALGLIVLFMRMWIPESPRWLMTHGRSEEAERIVADIEAGIPGYRRSAEPLPRVRLRTRTHTPLVEAARAMFVTHRNRAGVSLALMAAQAFFYNAIFFTYALVLTDFFGIAANQVGWYILPFAAGNFLGPLLLGPIFDSWGRKPSITATYAISGILLAATGYLFFTGILSAATQTAAWTVIFFFASAAASAAYLTIGEVFPLEIRANAIAIFYAFGTALGGVAGPLVFGELIESGAKESILAGYLLCAALMLVAAVLEAAIGVRAERRSLESVAAPLSSL